jgi:hypothetical protein
MKVVDASAMVNVLLGTPAAPKLLRLLDRREAATGAALPSPSAKPAIPP